MEVGEGGEISPLRIEGPDETNGPDSQLPDEQPVPTAPAAQLPQGHPGALMSR